MHRRRIVQMLCVAALAPIIAINALGGPQSNGTPDESPVIVVPDDHRVLSLPIDGQTPPLESGDRIDLYLSIPGFAGNEGEIELLDDVGLVVSVGDAAFSVAVAAEQVGAVAEAIRGGGVLVVRR